MQHAAVVRGRESGAQLARDFERLVPGDRRSAAAVTRGPPRRCTPSSGTAGRRLRRCRTRGRRSGCDTCRAVAHFVAAAARGATGRRTSRSAGTSARPAGRASDRQRGRPRPSRPCRAARRCGSGRPEACPRRRRPARPAAWPGSTRRSAGTWRTCRGRASAPACLRKECRQHQRPSPSHTTGRSAMNLQPQTRSWGRAAWGDCSRGRR